MKSAIIIFVRKPELGKVKTRLAAEIGEPAALAVYERLLAHTCKTVQRSTADKFIYYHQSIEVHDLWSRPGFFKKLQVEAELGTKMKYAFQEIFGRGYQKVLIIGSDCPHLQPSLLEQAFRELDEKEVVIGPATDGGYYLLGMRKLIPDLFENKQWSTSTVLSASISDLENAGLNYALLKDLSDIDHAKDLPENYLEELRKLHLM